MCSGCHPEIATGFSSPRNDECGLALVMTIMGYCHCEWNEAIHKPQKVNAKTEKKKNSLPLFPFVIANEVKQSTTTNSLFIHKKEKEFTTNNKYKNRKIKEFYEWIIVPYTEIATISAKSRNDSGGWVPWCPILRLLQAFGLHNEKFWLCVVVAIPRLPRLFQSLAMTSPK